MPITIAQSKSANTGAGTAASLSATFDSALTVGRKIIAIVGSSATQTMVNAGFTLVQSAVDFTGLYLWEKIVAASEPTTIQTTMSAPNRGAIWIAELAGNSNAAADQSANNVPASSIASIASGTTPDTTQADEMAIAAVSISRAASGGTSAISAWSNGFAEVAQIVTSGGDAPLLGIATKSLSTTGPQGTTATLTASESHPVGVIATFKATSALTYDRAGALIVGP